jgi:peptidyl-prolyl cis-trans isomerase SurA
MQYVFRFLAPALVVAGLALTAAACGRSGTSATSSPDVWATVDGRELRKDDVEKIYRRVAQTSPAPSEEEALTAKLSLLNELIVQDILVARATDLKIAVTDAELDAAFAERKKNMAEDAFQKELAARGLTSDDMKAALKRELTAEKVVEREVTSKIAITDQEVTDYYNANRGQFNLAEPAYRIAQIVITPVKDPQITNRQNDDAITPEQAARKAQMLMERLKGGAPFSEMAKEYSEDPESAPNGGDLGFVPLSALKQAPPALADAALKAEPGNVRLVSGGGAFTLVLLVAKESAGQRDLSTPGLKDQISSSLRQRREQLLKTAYLTAARADAQVTNYLARNIVSAQGKAPSLLPSPGK